MTEAALAVLRYRTRMFVLEMCRRAKDGDDAARSWLRLMRQGLEEFE